MRLKASSAKWRLFLSATMHRVVLLTYLTTVGNTSTEWTIAIPHEAVIPPLPTIATANRNLGSSSSVPHKSHIMMVKKHADTRQRYANTLRRRPNLRTVCLYSIGSWGMQLQSSIINFKIHINGRYIEYSLWNGLGRIPQDLSDNLGTLFKLMAWCRPATNHHLNQYWSSCTSPYDITSLRRVLHTALSRYADNM